MSDNTELVKALRLVADNIGPMDVDAVGLRNKADRLEAESSQRERDIRIGEAYLTERFDCPDPTVDYTDGDLADIGRSCRVAVEAETPFHPAPSPEFQEAIDRAQDRRDGYIRIPRPTLSPYTLRSCGKGMQTAKEVLDSVADAMEQQK